MTLAALCKSNPQVAALVDDLGLIPVDSLEYVSIRSSAGHQDDPFEYDRLLFYNGYVAPECCVIASRARSIRGAHLFHYVPELQLSLFPDYVS